jgi:mono/diheme cytochrome c family protein
LRRAAYVPVCLIAICGCGASTAGSSSHTTLLPSRQSPAVNSAGGSAALLIAPPASVTRAGGSELAKFELGRTVVSQSGCLGCHRIGSVGPTQPGPALTHVGSLMRAHSIERVLIDAEPPMPSFRQLPRAKFAALVLFLTLLRCPGHPRGLSPQGC